MREEPDRDSIAEMVRAWTDYTSAKADLDVERTRLTGPEHRFRGLDWPKIVSHLRRYPPSKKAERLRWHDMILRIERLLDGQKEALARFNKLREADPWSALPAADFGLRFTMTFPRRQYRVKAADVRRGFELLGVYQGSAWAVGRVDSLTLEVGILHRYGHLLDPPLTLAQRSEKALAQRFKLPARTRASDERDDGAASRRRISVHSRLVRFNRYVKVTPHR